MKQQEIRRNKGKKDKEIEKEETKNTAKTATFLWRFFWAIFHYKTGHFLKMFANFCPPIEVIYIYIYARLMTVLLPFFGFSRSNSSLGPRGQTLHSMFGL